MRWGKRVKGAGKERKGTGKEGKEWHPLPPRRNKFLVTALIATYTMRQAAGAR